MKSTVYLVAGKIKGCSTVLQSYDPVSPGDLVSYRFIGEEYIVRAEGVIQTTEGSELHEWMKMVSKIAEKKVTGIYRPSM